ncbi:MAG: lipid-A-disaccharide synthase N-terminal domain-containing protein [Gammaproteobacteria bacterium]|nr:lipid-A-disaccharide synthase N-terminal domain-containing protein [Gammaproteobacteria bacterium]MCP5198399.1 lipid-A-disaccharide synthase N-terminal domain-containing protein [Gammaproteobacteria bacterium]
MTNEQIWVGIGLSGQLLFSGRWLVQWITSERRRRSVIPLAFWYFSIAGSLTLLAYALYRMDPVFILGHVANSVIYIRNLVLLMREKRLAAAP